MADLLPRRVHRPRSLRRARPDRRRRQRRHPRPLRRVAVAQADGRGRRRRPERDDGRPGGAAIRARSTGPASTRPPSSPTRPSTPRPSTGRSATRSTCTIADGGDRQALPAGPAQPPRGAGRGRARRGRGCRHGHGEAGADLPRRHRRPCGARVDVPVAAYHVSGEYAMVKAAAERAGSTAPAVALEQLTAHQAGRRRLRPDLLRRRGGRGARWLSVGDSNEDWFARAHEGHPRRGRLAGPLVRARSAARLHGRAGAGRLRRGRRRARATSTSSSPTAPSILGHAHPAVVDGGRGGGRRGARPSARRPTGEVLLAEAICEPGARLRAGPPGLVGNRGGHERGPAGPGRHRSRPRS